MKTILSILLSICLLLMSSVNAATPAISLSRGISGIDGMNGFAIGLKHYWGNIANINNAYVVTGLWDANLSYWQSKDAVNKNFANITIASLSPVFRLKRRFAFDNGIAPYLDLGYGIGILNRDQFSNQQLGGYGTFLLTMGFGINFGNRNQYELGYHYLTYNNADQFKHDDGMFINSISFSYHFDSGSSAQ